MNLRVHEQMTGLQEQEICTVRCTPICQSPSHCPVQPMSLQDLALSALASCFDPGYSSLSALDLFPFYSTFATFAQLLLLTTGFCLIAFLLQRGILCPGYPVSLQNPGADIILWCPIWDLRNKASTGFTPPNPLHILVVKTEGCLMTVKYQFELHLLIEWSSFNYLKDACMRNDETPHKSTVPTEVSNKLLRKWIWRTTISNQAALSLLMQIP